MPKINFIHTSDLHLTAGKGDPLESLKWILLKAREQKAAVVICGDLFNSDRDAAALDASVRSAFSSYRDVTTFVIPGHCDERSFADKPEYGSSVKVMTDLPFSEIDHNGLRVVGVPYQSGSSLMDALNDCTCSALTMLLVHGTLFDDSARFIRDEIRQSGKGYFPVFPDDITAPNIAYVAMGHFHSHYAVIDKYSNTVCYPGTPVSLAGLDAGPRRVAQVVIDTESGAATVTGLTVELDTYGLNKRFVVSPGNEKTLMRMVMKFLADNAGAQASVNIELTGYVTTDKGRLDKAIQSIIDKYNNKCHCLNVVNNTTSCQQLIEHNEIAGAFCARLSAADKSDDVKNRALDLFLTSLDSPPGVNS